MNALVSSHLELGLIVHHGLSNLMVVDVLQHLILWDKVILEHIRPHQWTHAAIECLLLLLLHLLLHLLHQKLLLLLSAWVRLLTHHTPLRQVHRSPLSIRLLGILRLEQRGLIILQVNIVDVEVSSIILERLLLLEDGLLLRQVWALLRLLLLLLLLRLLLV